MTNATIDHSVDNEQVVLWQYDQAPNLVGLIGKWNALAKMSTEDFWDGQVEKSVLNIDTASAFGLRVWGNILGVPWPTIRVPDDSKTSGYRIDAISSDLYRRLLKYRFYMDAKAPTITNYNRGLEMLFPSTTALSGTHDGEVARYVSRSHVMDFSNAIRPSTLLKLSISSVGGSSSDSSDETMPMTMGFTFPTDETDEEAYLFLQHPELIQVFPAGICTSDSFVRLDRSIGFANQELNNFANAFAWADDTTANGGILADTPFSNYLERPDVKGHAFIVNVSTGGSSSDSTVKVHVDGTDEIWIDWGTSHFNYYSEKTTYSNPYALVGRYALTVYHSFTTTPYITIGSSSTQIDPTYTLL